MAKKKARPPEVRVAPQIAPALRSESAKPVAPNSLPLEKGEIQRGSPAAPVLREGKVLSDAEIRRDYPWRFFGAHVEKDRTTFRVYAPEATEVLLLRDGNGWGHKKEYLHRDPDGVWHITLSENLLWKQYKYMVRNRKPYLKPPYEMARIDPFSPHLVRTELPGGGRNFNSVVADPNHFKWTKKHLVGPASVPVVTGRDAGPTGPMSIYELHLSTFWNGTYREIADKIISHVGYMGFTHVQIMPPFQTPIHESWGYLVGCPYAVNERYGTADDFKFLVNRLHENNLGVIVDAPLGFGIQDWDCGLAGYDGTDLYHHAGARGWNNQWKTRIYNHRSAYVRDYLIGICSYAHHELGVDGVRIDAVSGQIFFDYDRGFWDWPRNDRSKFSQADWDLINGLGGERHFPDRGYLLSEAVDLDALRFFRDLHLRLQHVAPNLFTIAEESRRVFPRLACPVDAGGLGFTYAQNMGEMHRIRKYLQIPTEYRKIEHVEMIIHNKSEEKFVNAMNTHDECANGKVRLITELGNHVQLIGLAALCWFRAGAPMIFMGDEFGEEGIFDINRQLDWAKAGPLAALHQRQILANFHDLNWHLTHEPALARHEISSMVRNGSNNERKWFSFIRWGGDKRWESDRWEDHRDDIIFVRNESPVTTHTHAEIYVPAAGEYRVLYNSIDEKYIGVQPYNRHNPYWTIRAGGKFIYIALQPYQNLALKLKS
jgi:1,4-alpha-glucan branching enzyme